MAEGDQSKEGWEEVQADPYQPETENTKDPYFEHNRQQESPLFDPENNPYHKKELEHLRSKMEEMTAIIQREAKEKGRKNGSVYFYTLPHVPSTNITYNPHPDAGTFIEASVPEGINNDTEAARRHGQALNNIKFSIQDQYYVVLVPYIVDPELSKKLLQFREAGGKIFWTGTSYFIYKDKDRINTEVYFPTTITETDARVRILELKSKNSPNRYGTLPTTLADIEPIGGTLRQLHQRIEESKSSGPFTG